MSTTNKTANFGDGPGRVVAQPVKTQTASARQPMVTSRVLLDPAEYSIIGGIAP